MKPPSGRKYAIFLFLILAGVLVSGSLLTGPLKHAGDDFAAPVREKGASGESDEENSRPVGKLYLLFFLGVTVLGAHLAARFLSDRTWRKKDAYVRVVGWSILDVLALILLFLALIGLYQLILAPPGGPDADRETTVGNIVAVPVAYLIVLLFGIWILKQRGGRFAEGMGLTMRPYGRLILIGVVAFLAFQPFRIMYTTAMVGLFYNFSLPIETHPVVDELLKPDGLDVKVSLALSVVVSAPFFEEVYFRGFLYQALRRRTDAWAAIVLTAALFASIHPGWFQASLIFALGLLLAYLMEKTGSVIPCMVVHFLVNTESLLQTLLVTR